MHHNKPIHATACPPRMIGSFAGEMMNWIITAVAWILAVFLATRTSARTRLLGVAIAIIAGALLGIGEFNRGRVCGRIENGVEIGSAVLTNLASAVQTTLEGIIRSNRIEGAEVSAEHKAMFSNALDRSKREDTDANTASQSAF